MAQTTGTHVVQVRKGVLSRLRLRLSVPFQHRDAQFEIRWFAREMLETSSKYNNSLNPTRLHLQRRATLL